MIEKICPVFRVLDLFLSTCFQRERKRKREKEKGDRLEGRRTWYAVFVDDGVRTKGLINNGSIKGLSDLSRGSRTGATSDT